MTTSPHDVLIVGGGAAGLRAAIAVAESHPRLSVAIVSKVYPMRSHTVSAEGGAAAVIRAPDSLEEHVHDTISGGDWLCDQDAVEAFVKEAPEELLRLEHWGCPWSREADGHVAVRPFGGMKQMRTWFAADKTGFHLLHTLFQTSLKYDRIVRYDEWFVTRLLVDDGRACGVVAVDLMSGRIEPITARAVILATGGCGRVFPFTTNANIKTGDGMALAFRAGAPLKDMEFVQYHPTGLPFTGILITEAARAEGGWLLNKDGYRYLQDYDLGKPEPTPVLKSMELGPRDRLSQAFVKEVEKGKAIDGPHGPVVHLDLRHLGEELITAKLPFVRELCLEYEGIDPVRPSVDSLPVITRSTPSGRMAAANAAEVCRASDPASASSLMCSALSAPIASALRSASVAVSGPIVTTVTAPPCFSMSCRAVSTPRVSISSMTASTDSRSSVQSDSLSVRSDHVSGTCLIKTAMSIAWGHPSISIRADDRVGPAACVVRCLALPPRHCRSIMPCGRTGWPGISYW